MQKIGNSTSTANGAGEFASGQPGSGIDATMIMAAWLNTIQRELCNLVEGSGQALVPADDTQVLKAVQALQAAASTWAKLSGKPTTISGFGITDAFNKTETSAAIQKAVADLVASSPDALDTLKELAEALGNDPNFATTVTNALAQKANKATTLTGYGIVLAGQTEAEGGTENTKPVTALRVFQAIAKVVTQATESALGWAKLATQALVNAGTDDATIVTPKKLRFGFAASFTLQGYIVFPSWALGFTVQWGSVAGAGAVTFPIAFSTAFIAMAGSNAAGNFASTTTLTATSVLLQNSGNQAMTWFAIGRV